MNKVLKPFKLASLGACLSVALMTGAVTTANASSHADEVRAAQAAKIDLKQAITIASKQASGILVSAEFDDDDSDATNGKGGVYELEFSTDSINYEIKVDANTGKIVKTESERLDGDDINDYQLQKKAKITIMKAMTIAEKQTGGKVLEIEFKNKRDYADHPLYYKAKLLKGNSIVSINVDAKTGKTFANKFKK